MSSIRWKLFLPWLVILVLGCSGSNAESPDDASAGAQAPAQATNSQSSQPSASGGASASAGTKAPAQSASAVGMTAAGSGGTTSAPTASAGAGGANVAAAPSGSAGSSGSVSQAGSAAAAGSGGSVAAAGSGGGAQPALEHFSFFMTSYAALQRLSGSRWLWGRPSLWRSGRFGGRRQDLHGDRRELDARLGQQRVACFSKRDERP